MAQKVEKPSKVEKNNKKNNIIFNQRFGQIQLIQFLLLDSLVILFVINLDYTKRYLNVICI